MGCAGPTVRNGHPMGCLLPHGSQTAHKRHATLQVDDSEDRHVLALISNFRLQPRIHTMGGAGPILCVRHSLAARGNQSPCCHGAQNLWWFPRPSHNNRASRGTGPQHVVLAMTVIPRVPHAPDLYIRPYCQSHVHNSTATMSPRVLWHGHTSYRSRAVTGTNPTSITP